MKWTNEYGLHPLLAHAIEQDDYDHDSDPNHYAAHELINPARMTVLMRRHRHEIVKDVGKAIKLWMGTALHAAIEAAIEVQNVRSMTAMSALLEYNIEERLEKQIGRFRVSGKIDAFHRITGSLVDWKSTSVWAVMKQDKKEWENQLNIYAYLERENGREVNDASVHAILTDWRPGESKQYGSEYPPINYMVKPMPLWSQQQAFHFITARLGVLDMEGAKPDDRLPICTQDERWTRDAAYAVMKEGRKRAVKLFREGDGLGEADAWAYIKEFVEPNKQNTHDVEHRPGRDVRCEEYCDACEFCSHYQQEVKPMMEARA